MKQEIQYYVNNSLFLFITTPKKPISSITLWITLCMVWITFTGIVETRTKMDTFRAKPLFVVT